jgi:hypothetical protein
MVHLALGPGSSHKCGRAGAPAPAHPGPARRLADIRTEFEWLASLTNPIRAWAQTCNGPPWTDATLNLKVASATQSPRGPFAGTVRSSEPTRGGSELDRSRIVNVQPVRFNG